MLLSDGDDGWGARNVALNVDVVSNEETSTNHNNNGAEHNNVLALQRVVVVADEEMERDEEASNGSNRSLSSTISSSLRSSLDYEAEQHAQEADEEDENESEEAQRARTQPRANPNLLNVQSFLKCFGQRECAASVANPLTIDVTGEMFTLSSCNNNMQPLAVGAQFLHSTAPALATLDFAPTTFHLSTATVMTTSTSTTMTPAIRPTLGGGVKRALTESGDDGAARQMLFVDNSITHAATAAPLITAVTATVATTTTAAATTKPTKFNISTKFLHKPRNKLKTAALTGPDTAVAPPTQPNPVNFSIDSLLNK